MCTHCDRKKKSKKATRNVKHAAHATTSMKKSQHQAANTHTHATICYTCEWCDYTVKWQGNYE